MAATAGYGPLPPINSGPSLRQYQHQRTAPASSGSSSPERITKKNNGEGRHHRDVQQGTKPTSSSPRKKQAAIKKNRLPEVPSIIKDLENGVEHKTGKLLGSGGFARVYQVIGPDGTPLAFKAITKDSILNHKKNRSKVLAEILIHRSLNHRNIVKFIDLFQDENNIYYKLELCSNGSMNDMIKTRGRCLEEETRFYMVQILAACQNMHNNHVIHRDLKLGNIFLDIKMHVKIGDFGLAALLKDPEERKKTMCGTPNYIAPEILYDGENAGHSFEVDVWSVGVILYTLLVGKPPFQTSSVPAIYEKIKNNDYRIPADVNPLAGDLIKRILTNDPSKRPTLVQIMNHPWFSDGPIPLHLPSTAAQVQPYLNLSSSRSEAANNLASLKTMCGWRDDADDEVEEEEMTGEDRARSAREKRREQEKAEDERERMDSEFERAIQPGSSLSDFLKMGRQTLVKAPQMGGPLRPKATSTLSRQLSALSISRQQSVPHMQQSGKLDAAPSKGVVDKENAGYGKDTRLMPPPSGGNRIRSEPLGAEEKRMLGQKARLVAGMAAGSSLGSSASTESLPPCAKRQNSAQPLDDDKWTQAVRSSSKGAKTTSMELMVQNLTDALQCAETNEAYRPSDEDGNVIEISFVNKPDQHNRSRERPEGPKNFVLCWLDEMDHYGLAYGLSDGSVGAYLRDETSITVNAKRTRFDHISKTRVKTKDENALKAVSLLGEAPCALGTTFVQRRENYVVPQSCEDENEGQEALKCMSSEVLRRFKVLGYFEDKIMNRLAGSEPPLMQRDDEIDTGMTFVWKWHRCLQAIVFRLSSSVIQFNFYDHTKLLLSHDGLVVSVIETTTEADPTMQSWTLMEFVSLADRLRSSREVASRKKAAELGGEPELAVTTHEERKLVRSMMPKLRYARETLCKILLKSGSTRFPPSRSGNTAVPKSNSGQSVASLASSSRR